MLKEISDENLNWKGTNGVEFQKLSEFGVLEVSRANDYSSSLINRNEFHAFTTVTTIVYDLDLYIPIKTKGVLFFHFKFELDRTKFHMWQVNYVERMTDCR